MHACSHHALVLVSEALFVRWPLMLLTMDPLLLQRPLLSHAHLQLLCTHATIHLPRLSGDRRWPWAAQASQGISHAHLQSLRTCEFVSPRLSGGSHLRLLRRGDSCWGGGSLTHKLNALVLDLWASWFMQCHAKVPLTDVSAAVSVQAFASGWHVSSNYSWYGSCFVVPRCLCAVPLWTLQHVILSRPLAAQLDLC